jgi:hypothetical protein
MMGGVYPTHMKWRRANYLKTTGIEGKSKSFSKIL